MFGLDPLSRPVAIAEILLLLSLASVVGWLIARFLLNSRVSALQAQIATKEAELDRCRRTKAAGMAGNPASNVPSAAPRPAPVMTAPPVVPAMGAPIMEVPAEVAVPVNTPITAPVDAPKPAPVVTPVAGPMTAPVAMAAPTATPAASSEDAVLSRIAARANEINFDRIGMATAAEADDLKAIAGVGPFLERKLHSLGIYTFRQVGNFTKEDVDKVNEIIEFFPGRIQRDDWVGQSKEFYEKKYGGEPTR